MARDFEAVRDIWARGLRSWGPCWQLKTERTDSCPGVGVVVCGGGEGHEALSVPASTPLTLPPCPPATPQKLKEEIADVFAQIDCFETAEER